jgi:chemotaxis protein histidine kinase CheA
MISISRTAVCRHFPIQNPKWGIAESHASASQNGITPPLLIHPPSHPPMTSSSPDDNYSYFLAEAEDLLQTIERELLTLQEQRTPAKVHHLMRAAHTLKGAATSVGMETMKQIAHALEDVFRALYNPAVEVDAELNSLLFQGYECLRLCLQEAFSYSTSAALEPHGLLASEKILNRVASIISQLQQKLGDFFHQEMPLPSSTELGFDMVQSIFEMGVQQRLEALQTTLQHPRDAETVRTELQNHAEVFLGLAESLSLPGWEAIAKTTLKALQLNPDQAIEIAHYALADFQKGQIAVLGGDRTTGGSPSAALAQLAVHSVAGTLATSDLSLSLDDLGQALGSSLDQAAEQPNPNLESFWEEVQPLPVAPDPSNSPPPTSILDGEVTTTQGPYSTDTASPKPMGLPSAPVLPSIRVDVETIERLNYLSGELLINQNKQVVETEHLQNTLQQLLRYLQYHQQTLSSLQDWADRLRLRQIAQHPFQEWIRPYRKVTLQDAVAVVQLQLSPISTQRSFDALELEPYNEMDALLQGAWEETAHLGEVAETLDALVRQATLSLEKQQRLMTHMRNDLTTARMQPVGDILNRLPRVLEQLSAAYHKPVEFTFTGTEVLVDKAIAEKLYDPLLHLVRNAFDHGIEPVEIRQAAGKPTTGKIQIHVLQQGSRILIQVQDDGRGIDFDRIRQRAIALNLLSSDQIIHASQDQLLELLFRPGFSTVAKLSDLSGRGVGLDIVRSQLQALGGVVTVHSHSQIGTTFSLQIPLTLTITKLMLCQAKGVTYALTTEAIEQILMPKSEDIRYLSGERILLHQRDHVELSIPLKSLSHLLTYTPNKIHTKENNFTSRLSASLSPLVSPSVMYSPSSLLLNAQDSFPVLLVKLADGFVGLEVDQIIGEQELVIRPLGSLISSPKYICGSSILSGSRMALVIDVNILLTEKSHSMSGASLSRVDPPVRSQVPLSMKATLLPSPQSEQLSLLGHLPELLAGSSQPLPASLTQILVVDDSVTIRQMLAKTLQRAGYRVIQAIDGEEAWQQLQDRDLTGLGIICDLEMPRLNGFELLNRCRQTAVLSQIPILILTSRTSSKHRQLALELGASAYITKPYVEQELLALLASFQHSS